MTTCLTLLSAIPDDPSDIQEIGLLLPTPSVMRTIGAFRTWLRDEGYSPRTREQYLSYVTRACVMLGPLTRATPDTLREWWSQLPPTPSSRNAARNALLAYYRHRGTKHPPAAMLPCIPERLTLPRPVAVETYERFITASDELAGKHRVLGYLLAYTGCRISEARTGRRSQFDLTGRSWRIEGKGSRRRGPKERVVAVHPALGTVIGAWPEPDWMFPSPHRDGPIHRTTIGVLFRQIADHAALDITAHRIRHTVATIGLERSRDIRAVQELLGHADLGTTQRYTAVTGNRVRAVVDHLGPAA